MTVESYPFPLQGETYSAAITRRAINYLLARGSTVGSVVGGVVGGTDLLVTQNGTPNMSVNTAVGEAIVPGSSSSTQSGYYLYVSATQNTAVATSDPSNPRIDLVCANVSDTAYGGTDGGSIVVTKGTAAGSPVVPSTPTTSLAIANIAVAAAASSIVTANITDVRTFAVPGIGLWNTRRVSGAGAITAKHCDHIVVTSGSTPITLPAVAANARVKASNQGSGTPTVTQNASEKIFGAGLGSTGATTFSLGAPGATATLDGDSAAWTITAGNADSGWLTVGGTGVAWKNSWANFAGFTCAYRKAGNRLSMHGVASGGSTGTVALTLPSGYFRADQVHSFATDVAGNSFSVATNGDVTIGGTITRFDGLQGLLLD